MSDHEQSATQNPVISEKDEHHNVHTLHASIIREKAEPRDGFEPISPWLILFFGAVLFWGGYYLASYSGGFRPDVYVAGPGISVSSDPSAPPDPLVLGKRLYTANCVACHQTSGQGVAGQFPPLAGSPWVEGEPAVLKRILLHGMQGPVEVLGNTYNGNMPAFGARLDDEQLSAVLSFIRQEWGNNAEPISPQSIAATRSATRDRTKPWTALALQSITEEDPIPTDESKEKPAREKSK